MANVNPLGVQTDIGTPVAAYTEMLRHWELIQDLRGGTLAMRDATTKWLPREPKENIAGYNNRLSRSVLYPGYTDSVSRLVSKPFSKPVTVRGAESFAPQLQILENNADARGRTLTQFATKLFQNAIDYGKAHFLVDYPRLRGDETRAEEKELQARPRFVEIEPDSLIGWRVNINPGGVDQLVEVRILEKRIEYADDNPYLEVPVTYVRVYRPGWWQLWRQNVSRDIGWILIEEGPMTIPVVPIVTIYFKQTGEMEAHPAIEDVAWLNLAHWQSSSDHRNYLRFARIGFLVGSGFSQEEQEKLDSVGPGSTMWSSSENAKMEVVEHDGKAAEIGRQDLSDLQDSMRILGLQPFASQSSGNATATGKAIDEGRSVSEIQSWIRATECGIEYGYRLAAMWINAKLPDEFSVDIFNEFSISIRASEDIDNLIKMRVSREVSQRTFLEEMRRRGLLGEQIDIDDEISAIQDEAPALSNAGFGEEEDESEEDDDKQQDGLTDGAGSTD